MIIIALIATAALVGILINSTTKRRSHALLEEVERFNASSQKEIVQYNGRYFIRKPVRERMGGFYPDIFIYRKPYARDCYYYAQSKGSVTTLEMKRWTFFQSHALMLDTLEEAKKVLESLSIKYVDPKDGEVVYRENPKETSKDLILELIKAVEDGNKEKELEILHALGHK